MPVDGRLAWLACSQVRLTATVDTAAAAAAGESLAALVALGAIHPGSASVRLSVRASPLVCSLPGGSAWAFGAMEALSLDARTGCYDPDNSFASGPHTAQPALPYLASAHG